LERGPAFIEERRGQRRHASKRAEKARRRKRRANQLLTD